MEKPDSGFHWPAASKRVAQRLLMTCGNRFELLLLEAQEERERIVLAATFAVGAIFFALLAAISVTAIIVIAFWNQSPLIALGILAAIYAVFAVTLFVQLTRLQRDWKMLAGTLDQLKKDRECLEKNLN